VNKIFAIDIEGSHHHTNLGTVTGSVVLSRVKTSNNTSSLQLFFPVLRPVIVSFFFTFILYCCPSPFVAYGHVTAFSKMWSHSNFLDKIREVFDFSLLAFSWSAWQHQMNQPNLLWACSQSKSRHSSSSIISPDWHKVGTGMIQIT